MLRIALIATLVALTVASVTDQEWESFKTEHGKVYSPKEDLIRRMRFERSKDIVDRHNRLYKRGLKSYYIGLNKFSDMTSEERARYRGLRFTAASNGEGETFDHIDARSLPAEVDWRKKGYVTPVKDQGQCGSCWAFSTTGSLEGQHFAKTGKLVSLSEQNLVDCSGSYGNMGCNGGLMTQAFDYIKANGGVDTEKSYPYTGMDGTCSFKDNSIGATVRGYVNVSSGDEAALQKAVATVGPVSVAIDASQESFQEYSGGIYDEPNCSSTELDHGVLVVGYGSENGKDFWIVKNSWNSSWGDKGYIRMSRNKNNQCGIATSASYPTV